MMLLGPEPTEPKPSMQSLCLSRAMRQMRMRQRILIFEEVFPYFFSVSKQTDICFDEQGVRHAYSIRIQTYPCHRFHSAQMIEDRKSATTSLGLLGWSMVTTLHQINLGVTALINKADIQQLLKAGRRCQKDLFTKAWKRILVHWWEKSNILEDQTRTTCKTGLPEGSPWVTVPPYPKCLKFEEISEKITFSCVNAGQGISFAALLVYWERVRFSISRFLYTQPLQSMLCINSNSKFNAPRSSDGTDLRIDRHRVRRMVWNAILVMIALETNSTRATLQCTLLPTWSVPIFSFFPACYDHRRDICQTHYDYYWFLTFGSTNSTSACPRPLFLDALLPSWSSTHFLKHSYFLAPFCSMFHVFQLHDQIRNFFVFVLPPPSPPVFVIQPTEALPLFDPS